MFDCCHSGGIGEPKDATAAAVKDGLPASYYVTLSSGTGRVILASSRDTEYSWIQPGAVNSLFTEHLLAGLRGGTTSRDGFITIFDLFEYVSTGVTRARPDQQPIFKCQTEDNFPITLCLGGQKSTVPEERQHFEHDAFVTYVQEDEAWVEDVLVPRLRAAGIRVADSRDVAIPGVVRVVSTERGMRSAKRTLVVLSEAFIDNKPADFDSAMAQSMGIDEGRYRLIPVKISPLQKGQLPTRLSMLEGLDFSRAERAEREFDRLIKALLSDIPEM